MRFSVRTATGFDHAADCIVTAVNPKAPAADYARIGAPLAAAIRPLIERGDLPSRAGKTLLMPVVPGARAARVLLVSAPEAPVSDADFRKIASAAAQGLIACQARRAATDLHTLDVRGRDVYARARTLIAAVADGVYRFDSLKSKPAEPPPELRELALQAAADDRPALRRAVAHGDALAAGMQTTRDLGNLPGNHLTPSALASRVRALARGRSRLSVRVLGEAAMRELGMGSLLAVAAGSQEEAKLIAIEYRGAGRRESPYVLVGKGITFDTGGISLKPAAAMDEMKFDMCGAASVVGTLSAIDAVAAPINVVGVIAAAENMPGGRAIKPGDIVTSMSGQTIEILNTDAEGRLVLCDALTWVGRYRPRVVIDIATLTGAIITALGNHACGLFANDDELANGLIAAGDASGDRAWRMPLWDDYQTALRSNFADMANIANGREAGAIVAAAFLERYARTYRWAHLDVAGTAYRGGATKGATGRPVPLLFEYLLTEAGRR